MSANEQPSRDLLESIVKLRFPERSERRLQVLMDLNNNGQLSEEQFEELAGYVELSEQIALLRAQALQLLGRKPA